MNYVAHCIFKGHEEENTLGFCFNPNCSENPEFCYECQQDRQQNHTSDCFRFRDILQVIKNKFEQFSQMEIKISLELLRIQQQFQKLQESLKQKKQILNTLFDYINGGDYNKAKQNFSQLRECIKENTEFLNEKIELILQKSNEFQNTVQEGNQFFRDYLLNQKQDYNQTPTKLGSEIMGKKGNHQFQEPQIGQFESHQIRQVERQDFVINNSQNLQKDQQQKLQIEIQQNSQGSNQQELEDEDKLFQEQLKEIQHQEQFLSEQKIQNAQQLLLQAQQLMLQDNFREALKIFKDALNQDSENDEIYFYYSQALTGQGQELEALKMIDKCIQLNSKYQEAYVIKAYILKELDRNQEALQLLKKFENSNSLLDSKFYLLISQVLYSLGNLDETIKYCDQAINFDKTLGKAYVLKAASYERQNKFDLALENYNLAIQYYHYHPVVLKRKGDLLRKMGRYDEALECYDKVIIQNDGESQKGCNDKLELLLQLGRNNEALIFLDERITLDPNNRQLYLQKIPILKKLNRHQEAEHISNMISQI